MSSWSIYNPCTSKDCNCYCATVTDTIIRSKWAVIKEWQIHCSLGKREMNGSSWIHKRTKTHPCAHDCKRACAHTHREQSWMICRTWVLAPDCVCESNFNKVPHRIRVGTRRRKGCFMSNFYCFKLPSNSSLIWLTWLQKYPDTYTQNQSRTAGKFRFTAYKQL